MDLNSILYSLARIVGEMAPYILLGFLIAGILHAFVSNRTMSRHLAGNGWKPVIKAALFGIPLPLCSCGVLPTAIGLRRSGASKGATTSFLIATPQTGVDSIAATYSLLGLPFALIRPLAALVGATVGGYTVSKLQGDTSGEECAVFETPADSAPSGPFGAKLLEALRYGFVDMVASVGKWLVIGLVIAALITVFVPDSLFVALSEYPLLAMLAVVIVAIPMYICATGSIPIALSLMLKGLSPGIAFVMLMAGPAANFASIVLLSRNLGRRATIIYVGAVVVTAIAFGLAIDLLLPAHWFIPSGALAHAGCHATLPGTFELLCSALLVVLLVNAAVMHRHHEHNHSLNTENMETKVYKIKGMNCPHCQASVEKAIAAVAGVDSVSVSLSKGEATVSGKATSRDIAAAVGAAGFDCE